MNLVLRNSFITVVSDVDPPTMVNTSQNQMETMKIQMETTAGVIDTGQKQMEEVKNHLAEAISQMTKEVTLVTQETKTQISLLAEMQARTSMELQTTHKMMHAMFERKNMKQNQISPEGLNINRNSGKVFDESDQSRPGRNCSHPSGYVKSLNLEVKGLKCDKGRHNDPDCGSFLPVVQFEILEQRKKDWEAKEQRRKEEMEQQRAHREAAELERQRIRQQAIDEAKYKQELWEMDQILWYVSDLFVINPYINCYEGFLEGLNNLFEEVCEPDTTEEMMPKRTKFEHLLQVQRVKNVGANRVFNELLPTGKIGSKTESH